MGGNEKRYILFFGGKKSKNRLQSITFFLYFEIYYPLPVFFPLAMSNATYRYGQHAKLSQLTFLYR